jgi:TPP-dependent pyruvate/acetoin dehydrogenase alpha subunit
MVGGFTMKSSIERRKTLTTPIGRLERMVEIRLVEESIQQLYNDGHVRGSTHLANGQEAVSVGMASVLNVTDSVTCTYRGHATALALGVSPEGVLGEICGRQIGCVGGVGGSMHLSDSDVGLMPTFAIVGAGLPVAAGAALASKFSNDGSIAVSICGDGATNIGAFHETLNMAQIMKLPVIFVIENNLYGEYTRINLSTPIDDLALRADAYAMRKEIVDGQDLDAVIKAFTDAAAFARSGQGPTLLEMKTYRYSGHSRSDPATYRPDGELDQWKLRDPIDIFNKRLIAQGVINEGQLTEMFDRQRSAVEESIKTVLSSPAPELSTLLKHVTA